MSAIKARHNNGKDRSIFNNKKTEKYNNYKKKLDNFEL